MKLNGEFILREVVGEYVLVPVGETALKFNGIVSLNEVGAEIWKGLQQGEDREALLRRVLDAFEVGREEAEQDLSEFLGGLEENGFLSE